MPYQLLRRQAMHLAQLLPDDPHEAATVMGYVRELHKWGGTVEANGNIFYLPPTLEAGESEEKKPQQFSAPVVIMALLLAFTVGWFMEPPILIGTVTRACNGAVPSWNPLQRP